VTAVATYSPIDAVALTAQGIPASTLPLAFDTSVSFTSRPAREIVFVGAAYPGRVATLCALHGAGVPVRGYGRDWSHAPFDRLRTWKLHRPDLPWGREIDRATGYGIMAGATATLNLHGVQDGFTMRTFEACGAGALQIVDRREVSLHFDVGTEVVAFDSPDELLELSHRAMKDRVWRDTIALAGQRRALAEHTFVHRARVLASMWN
jgi:spore maturation protein CgeB